MQTARKDWPTTDYDAAALRRSVVRNRVIKKLTKKITVQQ